MTARPTVRLSSRPTSVSACPERTSTRLDTLPFSTSQPKESVRTRIPRCLKLWKEDTVVSVGGKRDQGARRTSTRLKECSER